MNDAQEFLERMQTIVREGGKIALLNRSDSQPALKADSSVVTKSDKEIAVLTHHVLEDLLSRPEHVLIDEEDPRRVEYFSEDFIQGVQYIWTVDPIDGTRVYANGMPHFGISMGVLKNLKPWLGMVYFPVLQELFYCDGEKSFFVQNAFTAKEQKIPISPIDLPISSQSIFLCNDAFYKHFEWDFKDCHVMIQSCAVVDLCWPAIGRGCGALLRSYIWDFAGSWPIAHSAGLRLRNFHTGEILDSLDLKALSREHTPWKMKDYYILSSERNFTLLRSKIRART